MDYEFFGDMYLAQIKEYVSKIENVFKEHQIANDSSKSMAPESVHPKDLWIKHCIEFLPEGTSTAKAIEIEELLRCIEL